MRFLFPPGPRRWRSTAAHSTWSRRGSGPGRARRAGRARQQALRHLDPAGAALRRARDRRGSGLDRAAAETACRRRPDRPAERGQVLAARAAHPGGAEGGRLPVHDARAGLGTIEDEDRQAVLADIPGLIEGAAEGDGLGHEFLAHVERCSMLVHLVDLAPLEGDPPPSTRPCGPSFRPTEAGSTRCQSCSCSPSATCFRRGGRGRGRGLAERLGSRVLGVLAVSSATGEGLEELRHGSWPSCPTPPPPTEAAARRAGGDSRSSTASTGRARAATGSSARRTAPSGSPAGGSSCSSSATTSQRGGARLPRGAPREIGVVAALRAAGFEPGDDVRVGEHEFELHLGLRQLTRRRGIWRGRLMALPSWSRCTRARDGYTLAGPMTLVVKLGSSIVAADDGELRADVLDSVCEQVAALERGGERVVMVTSGAIARGMRLMELPGGRGRWTSCRRPRPSARATSSAPTRAAWRARRPGRRRCC